MVKTDELVSSHLLKMYISVYTGHHLHYLLFSPADDFRQLNDKLVEVNSSKMALQMKLDELEAAEVNIKVNYISVLVTLFYN